LPRKVFLFALLVCMFLFEVTCFAGSRGDYRINQFHYEIVKSEGQDVLRIEIGLDKNDPEYSVQINDKNNRQLILNLKRTKIGEVRPDITLDGKLGRYMTLRQQDESDMQVKIVAAKDIEKQNYKVYTLPADRKSQKSFRIVIEINQSAAKVGDTVSGVAGEVIVLDPGHGGSDSGAVGPDGIMEKDVTLAVTKKVKRILEASGANVVMTREDDRDVYGTDATDRQELQARVDVGARTPGMKIFVSIHANSFSNPQAHGTATYYYPKNDYDALLAQDIQHGVIEKIGLLDRGTPEANFYVMKHSNVPAVLLEMAFISNYNEESLLVSEDFQNNIALGICKGIGKFFTDTGL